MILCRDRCRCLSFLSTPLSPCLVDPLHSSDAVMENVRAGLIASALPVTSTFLASAAVMVKILDEGVARFGFTLLHSHNSWV